MQKQTGGKPFICKECEAGLVRNGILKQHASIHTGEKPFGFKSVVQDFHREVLKSYKDKEGHLGPFYLCISRLGLVLESFRMLGLTNCVRPNILK